ncbi:phosphotransferase [Clostridium sp.]|uniref:phosphotransferase n=1 Tax=Clostridium sp. TaxID=1506 RepID=UPI003D6D5663
MKYGKIIGVGNTATVYKWEDGKVLKLFYKGYSKQAVEREFHNAKAIKSMDFPKSKVYEIIFCEERMGIIYDRVEGESLLDWVMKTGDVQKCAVYMAKLHKAIGKNRISNVPNYKEFLRCNIVNIPLSNSKKREEVLQMLDKLQDGNTLCHGDFHPGVSPAFPTKPPLRN